MTEHRRIDMTHAAGAYLIEHCDIPAELTLGEWRRQCAAEAPGRRRKGALRRGLRRVLRRF